MNSTKISWTEKSWNPVINCTKISAGCKNCYAEKIAKRYPDTFGEFSKVTLKRERLNEPLKWKKPQLIFVVSMGDLFHKDVPTDYIKKVFNVMNQCQQHTFQVLTKRVERLEELSPEMNWTQNIWLGVSVEESRYTFRINHLRNTGANVKFLSLEPLLGNIPNLNLQGISWVIVGGESAVNYRPMRKEWAIDILQQCRKYNIPFFYKQDAGYKKADRNNLLYGRIYNEYPLLTNN
ncbi:MAG: phage Gp37/Gp68 family protein [Ignavibacteriae bacterium]|nr:phage Gp37/Gp68 family protein [Ignavibacteriota bacterium]